ncbi:MAG TPA: VTT domain-containing protein [Candidatus Xenobia bacterium]|nr:VTT domain-containing protein [Candidatus Xenobia bacterium]
MMESIQFLIQHGYTVIFLFVLAEQLGLPLPAIPLLLAAGALAGTGKLSLSLVLLAAVAASLVADSCWYELGRRKGIRVLQLLCRISLEPDSCVRRTEDVFVRHGARSLLVAKFIPGINTAAPPLAGIFRMRFGRFLAYDTAGAFLWAGAFIGLGWVFSDQLEFVADKAASLGGWLLAILFGGLGGYIGWKYYQRQRFLRALRIARITPAELKRKMDSGEDVVIVDLRHKMDFEAEPETIPGALHVPPEELEQRHQEIPRDRELILYCT